MEKSTIFNKLEVINITNYDGTDYIYIGRGHGCKYGNPFTSKKSRLAEYVGSKQEALRRFREYLDENPHLVDDLIKDLKENVVHKLGCWCSPSPCHGEIFIEKINERKYKSII